MLNVLVKPYFLGSVLLYGVIRLDRATDWLLLPEFIRYNFNDFLCLPIVLTLTVCILKRISHNKIIKLSPKLIFGEAILYSVMFELILPMWSLKYTADFMDVIMYFLGAYFYYGIQEVSNARQLST